MTTGDGAQRIEPARDGAEEPLLSLHIGCDWPEQWRLGLIGPVGSSEALNGRIGLKSALLRDYKPENYRGDVWHLTERDAGSRIDGSRNDTFVVSLKEHGASGFVWNFNDLVVSGFAIVRDVRESADPNTVGGASIRRVTAVSDDIPRGTIAFEERRPWLPSQPLSQISLDIDLSGPEQSGLSRAERRHLLQVV